MAGNPETKLQVKVEVSGAKQAKTEIAAVSAETQKAGRSASSAIPGFDALGQSVGNIKSQVNALKSALGLFGTLTAIVGAGVGLYKWMQRSREEAREFAKESAKVTEELRKLDKSGDMFKTFSDAIGGSKKSLSELSDLIEKYENHTITMEEFAAAIGITKEQLDKITPPADKRNALERFAGKLGEDIIAEDDARKGKITTTKALMETIKATRGGDRQEEALATLYEHFGGDYAKAANAQNVGIGFWDSLWGSMMPGRVAGDQKRMRAYFDGRNDNPQPAQPPAIHAPIQDDAAAGAKDAVNRQAMAVLEAFEKMMRVPEKLSRDDLLLAREIYQRYNAGDGIAAAVSNSGATTDGSLLGKRLSAASGEVEMAEILMKAFPELRQLDAKEEGRIERNRENERRRNDIRSSAKNSIDNIRGASVAESSVTAIGGIMGGSGNAAERSREQFQSDVKQIMLDMDQRIAEIVISVTE